MIKLGICFGKGYRCQGSLLFIPFLSLTGQFSSINRRGASDEVLADSL
jgi:hypothetical protein